MVAVQKMQAPEEQRILLHGVSWKDYVVIRELLDGPSPRMTYCKGELELMSPSPEHEGWKKNGARFVELYAFLKGIRLYALGNVTLKHEMAERGLEPDECYSVGAPIVKYPQIAIEVIHTSPLIDKLDIYRVMGVEEVWVYRDREFILHLLDPATKQYQVGAASRRLPDLDIKLLAKMTARADVPEALEEFANLVRRG